MFLNYFPVIKGEANAYPVCFLPTDENISTRTTTTSSVSWTFGDWEKDETYASPDLTTIVQDIVYDGLWSIGNAVAFTLEATGNKKRKAHTFDEDPQSQSYLLVKVTCKLKYANNRTYDNYRTEEITNSNDISGV
jgi:hypothetical protein